MIPKYTIVRFHLINGLTVTKIYTTKYWISGRCKAPQTIQKEWGQIWWIDDSRKAKNYEEAKAILEGLSWLDSIDSE